MKILYQLAVRLYNFLILLFSLFNSKARQIIKGRKQTFQILEQKQLKNPLWFHVSSLGEFEQARPVIEQLKQKNPNLQILVSFFSPSGYQIRKDYKYADAVVYLPSDTKANAKRFLELAKPSYVIWVKYDFWFNFLSEIQKQQIKNILISAIFRKNQFFFITKKNWFLKILKGFTQIFVQDEQSADLLKKYGFEKIQIAGDTRIDRVIRIAQQNRSVPIVEDFCKGSFCLIAGSTWLPDEKILSQLADKIPQIKIVIAPHQISDKHIRKIENLFKSTVRYSKYQKNSDKQVLIIDNIGLLAHIYKYGQIAYIGGGFGKGIHNILEPAVYGMPIIFGKKYHKFKEAKDLIELKGAFSINSNNQLIKIVKKFWENKTYLSKVSEIVKNYIEKNANATEKIINFVCK